MFIKVTTVQFNEKSLIRVETINGVKGIPEGGSAILLSNGEIIGVRDSIDEIEAQIRNSEVNKQLAPYYPYGPYPMPIPYISYNT